MYGQLNRVRIYKLIMTLSFVNMTTFSQGDDIHSDGREMKTPSPLVECPASQA